MPVPSTIADLSTTAASNSPAGTESIGTNLDNYLRAVQAIVKQNASKGADIASASNITIPNAGSYFVVTGTTTIATITDSWNGRLVVLEFSGALQLTHSANLILPGSANITTVSGDVFAFVNESTGVWRCVCYQPVGGYLTSASIGATVQAYDADIPTVAASQVEMEAGTEAGLRSMSPLRVAQAIAALGGGLQIASTAEAQAGTDNTKAITPLRMREGFNASGSAPVYACRAWVNFNGTGTVAIRASGNVSSITDNNTGDYTVNFTTAMEDANYSAVVGHLPDSTAFSTSVRETRIVSYSTTALGLRTGSGNPIAAADFPNVNAAVFR